MIQCFPGWFTTGKTALTAVPFFASRIVLILLCAGSISIAQQLDETVEQLPEDPAKEFVRPLADAIGANFNTGWINRSPSARKLGFEIKIGLVSMAALIDPDEDIFRVLDTVFPFQEEEAFILARNSIPQFDNLPPAQQDAIIKAILSSEFRVSVKGPTFFGSESDHVVVTTTDQTIEAKGVTYTILGMEIPLDDITGIIQDPGIFPTAAPQFSIGTIYGTAVTFRFIPDIKISDELGNLSYFGFGVQHNPLVWFTNEIPFEISLGFFTQTLRINRHLDVTTTSFGLDASKKYSAGILGVTPYVGYMFEKSVIDIDYAYPIGPGLPPIEFDFTIEGANRNRLILGLGFNLSAFNLFIDYNIAEVNNLSASLFFDIYSR